MDSAGKIVRCLQQAMDEVGLERLDGNQIRQIIGLGMHEASSTLFPEASQRQKSALQQAYARHFLAEDTAKPCEFFPGSLELLAELRERGHTLAVATGKSRRGLNRVFEQSGVGRYFDSSRCADETASKPHPKMLLELMAEFAVSSDQACMIGDTEFDLHMARQAGTIGVGVSFGVHDRPRLQSARPAYIADSHAQLGVWLKEQLGC